MAGSEGGQEQSFFHHPSPPRMVPLRQEAEEQSGAVGKGPGGQVGVLPAGIGGGGGEGDEEEGEGGGEGNSMLVVEGGFGRLGSGGGVAVVGVYSALGFCGFDEGRRWRWELTWVMEYRI